jgi:hypothetical protein
MRDEPVCFEAIRENAVSELDRWSRTRVGQWRPCVWQQYREASHVAPYCNVLSHLQALDDLLRFGTWCDHVELTAWTDDSDEAEMVFRYYGIVFLLWEELVADLRIIGGAATTGKSTKRKLSTTEPLMEFINRTWKHRSTPLRAGRPFHASHHHGPYVFTDVPGYRAALPADGAYAALDHHPSPGTTGPLVLVVPSITLAMTDLGRAMVETSSLLRDVSARQKVIDVYGARRF